MHRSLLPVLLLLSLIWGGSYFFIKILLAHFGPWTIAFLRSSLGVLTISLIMLMLRKPFGLRNISWVSMAVMALVHTSIPWAIIGFSETRLTSSMASVLNATTPLWTLILGIIFFRSVSNRYQWLGMGIAVMGLIVLLGIRTESVMSADLLGFIGMIAASLCYAAGSQLSKRLLHGLSMYQITFGTLLCAALSSGIIAFMTEDIPVSSFAVPSNLTALSGLGIFGSGIAYILFYFIVQKGSPEIASSVTYLLPVSGIVWGAVMLNEPIHWSLLLGMAFILGGVFLTSRTSSKFRLRSTKSNSLVSSD